MLKVNLEARQLHKGGLEAGLLGDYTQAHVMFGSAQQVLEGAPRTLDTIVQLARITRDDGFTYVRAALAGGDTSNLDQAQNVIERSAEVTALSVGLADLIGAHSPGETSKRVYRETIAEHGATISLLGRLATVREVMLGIDTRLGVDPKDDSEAANKARFARDIEQRPYILAHGILRKGNNGYYRVSNAMVGARQERLNGRLLHMAVWLGRAASGIAWTVIHDPSNLKAAVRTASNRAHHLLSYRAAKESVAVKP